MRASSVRHDTWWFLKGGGEMGKLIQCYSWEETELGDPMGWSEILKGALSLTLNSKIPSVLFWGPDHICFYNDACAPILQMDGKLSSALGKNGPALWPESWPSTKATIDSVLSKGQSIWHRDGPFASYYKTLSEETHRTFCYAPVYGKEGTPSGVLVTYVQADHERQFRNLFRQAPVGILVLSGEEMTVQMVNEMSERLIGRIPEELLYKQLPDVIPQVESDFRSIFRAVRLSEKPLFIRGQRYSYCTEGEQQERFLDFIYQPYRQSSEGPISGLMILCHDVTEHVNNGKKAEVEETKAKLAIGSAKLGTYEVNLLTGEVKTSERFNAIWGVEHVFSRDQLSSSIHPDDRAIAEAAHRDSMKAGYLAYDVRIVCNDKDTRWVRMRGTVVYNGNHVASGLIGVAEDITEQKNFANDLLKFVDERTREWQALNEELAATNEELSETNVHLTRANRELEEFAYVASHDLQEPLRKIQIFSNIIDEKFGDELSDGAAGYLRKITASARRMSNLIKNLLDYSRLTYNDSLFQSLDLNTIVKDVISDFEVLIIQKSTTIRMSELPVIEAIPIQMNQLFYNLIGNAIKFSRKGIRGEITITSRLLDSHSLSQYTNLKPGKPYYEITVKDNGIGFSQQYAEQIFTIFQRLNDRAIYGGYGIGLALCRKIIDNHSGLVFATGRENEGATFTVILPEYYR